MNLLEDKSLLRTLLFQGDKLNTIGGGVVEATTTMESTQFGYVVNVKAPSVKAEAFEVILKYNELNISAKNFQYDFVSNEAYIITLFTKSFLLPDNVDLEKVEAIHQHGELKVLLPLSEHTTDPGRTIDVKIF